MHTPVTDRRPDRTSWNLKTESRGTARLLGMLLDLAAGRRWGPSWFAQGRQVARAYSMM